MKKIHPAFILIVLLFLVFGKFFSVISFLLALVFHEFAHAFVARKLGYKLKNLSLMPYGACLMYQEIFVNDDELYIAVAGPFASFLTAVVAIAFWWIFPLTYSITYNFVVYSFSLGVFNLLPAFPLDGARICIGLLQKKMPRKQAFKVTVVFNYVFSAIFLISFFVSFFTGVNFNFLIISIFLILGVIDTSFQAKYLKAYNFDKSKPLKKGIKEASFVFSSDVSLYQMLKKVSLNKYTMFSIILPNGQVKVIGEDYLKKLCENFNHNLTFNDIFKFFDK